jgi:hypothetical protein
LLAVFSLRFFSTAFGAFVGSTAFACWGGLLGGEIDGGDLWRRLRSHLDRLREADRLRCLDGRATGLGLAVHQHQQSEEYRPNNKTMAQYWHSHLRFPSMAICD